MNIITLLTLQLSLSSKLLEYRPSINFGQVLFDFSGNGLHAVNGDASTSTTNDVFCTDRGAYFGGANQVITMPSNDVVPTPLYFPSVYSVIMWAYVFSYSSILYLDYNNPNTNFVVINTMTGGGLRLCIAISGGIAEQSGTYISNSNSY